MDHARLGSEFLRALRGKRSQRAFSQRIGYRSNIAFRWETGRCYPTAAQTFRLAKILRIDVRTRLASFLRVSTREAFDLTSRAGVAAFLSSLRGGRRLTEVAKLLSVSRFAVARWFSGEAEPKLPEFFALLEALSLRLVDFVTAFVESARLPSVAADLARLRAARDAAFEQPWSHAVLRALELESYRALPAHQPGWLAQRLGISREDEQASLALLERAGQARHDGTRFVPTHVELVDLRAEVERLRGLKAFWLQQAKARLSAGDPGVFGFNVFAASEADLGELRTLYLEFYQRMQALIARSTPSECVALFSAQLFRLDPP